MSIKFGPFIREKRIQKGLGQRELANKIGVSASYLNDIEKDKRTAPNLNIIKKISLLLSININKLNDLAGLSKKTLAPDISDFIIKNSKINSLIRTIKENNLNNKQIEFIDNNIIKNDNHTKLGKLMTTEITQRKMTLDRYLLFNTKPNWNQIYEIKKKIKQGNYNNILYSEWADDKQIGCTLSIQHVLNIIMKEYPLLDENNITDILKTLEDYCKSFNKDI